VRGVNVPALLASATHEVRLMTRPQHGPVAALRGVDRETVCRGVRYRIVVPDAARADRRLANRLGALAAAGAQVRTAPEVPGDALVIDGFAVVLPVDGSTIGSGPSSGIGSSGSGIGSGVGSRVGRSVGPGVGSGIGTAAGSAVFRLPSVVATTAELFERIWLTATPLLAPEPHEPTAAPAGALAARALDARERELLSLLSAGSTDESAAARLGVSVRTVRRMMADLMHRLGARSRFQAGAMAAGRGWLMEHAC
jgi:DNA-binding CsgD family transcriptional regulator